MYKFKLYLSIIFCILFLNQNTKAEDVIVFVNLDYIFINSNAGKKLDSFIKNESKNLKEMFDLKNKEIDKNKKQIINQKNVLSAEEYNNKVNLIEQEIRKFNKEIENRNSQISLFKNNAKNEYLNIINEILSTYAKKNSIKIILNKNDIVLADKNLDITNEILIEFDKVKTEFKIKK